MAATPPRPPPRAQATPPAPITQRTGAPSTPSTIPIELDGPEPLVEIDDATRARLTQAIAKAVAASLGGVRISSMPPSAPTPPRSSMRVAATVGAKVTGKLGTWGTMAIGALAVAGQVIVWFGKPEYAGPIAQALKLIAAAIMAYAGGGAPSMEENP